MVHTPGANRIGRLIKKYVAQVKDMQKSRGLAWYICYQEKFEIKMLLFGMITAREEGEEVKAKRTKNVKKY